MKPNRKPTRKNWWLIAGVGVIVAGVLFFLTAPLRRQAQARHDVGLLLLALNGYLAEQGDLPAGDFATICRLLRGESVAGQNPRRLDYVEGSAQEINAKGEFLDPWGAPYRIDFEPKLRVYSSGPNRIDDRGGADDIVAQ